MPKLYHCNQTILDPGSVIHPGNWGRCIQLIGWGHNHAFREAVFEDVRLRMFPTLPSRLTSVFAMPSVAQAKLYQARNQLMNIYEVEIANGEMPRHTGDWRIAAGEALPADLSLKWIEDYWRGQLLPAISINGMAPVETTEILVASPLRIKAKL